MFECCLIKQILEAAPVVEVLARLRDVLIALELATLAKQ